MIKLTESQLYELRNLLRKEGYTANVYPMDEIDDVSGTRLAWSRNRTQEKKFLTFYFPVDYTGDLEDDDLIHPCLKDVLMS